MRTIRGAVLGGTDGDRTATPLELFFDLCFVVAVAEVARVLHGDPTWHGVAVSAGLFVPIWWAWMAYTWHATAYDRDDPIERLGTLAGMLGILALAVGVSGAAEGDGFVFALAAAGLRIPLLLLWLRARHGAPPGVRGFSSRYAAGTAWAIAFWGASAFVESPAQEVLWAVALAGEMAAPYAAVRRADRPVYDPGHIVERYGLFTIIVLGESILAVVIGTGQVDLDPAAGLTAAFGFAASAAFWWLYFDRVGPGGLGRSRRAGFLWGYGHLVVWSGVAVIGVGTHLAVEASAGGVATAEAAAAGPGGYAGDTPLAFLPAGAALALTALAMIALTSGGLRQAVAVRLAGATLLTVSAFLADGLGPMPTAAITAAVLVIVTCVESRQAATGRSPGGGPATPS